MNRTLLFRKAVLTAAGNPLVRKIVTNYGMSMGVARFVAAETLEDTISKVKRVNGQSFAVTLDYLGESVDSRLQAEEAAGIILRTLDGIHNHSLDAHISVKLTQLGLLIDEELCLESMRLIVERAVQYETFVRIDMEDSAVTERTLRIFHRLAELYGTRHVGVVIQSYLYRSERDLEELEGCGANVRIVKGAYHEPKEVAYPDKKDVNRRYLALAAKHLMSGCYTAVATHDPDMIGPLKEFIRRNGVPCGQFEFQMLYGIAEGLQQQLRDEGYRVRIYTPFGGHWYSYFSRRIAERPANLWFVLKGIAGGRRSPS